MPPNQLQHIILYDIPCSIPDRPWSPNTMKTRYCLGYKRLPFTTVWVEFPDIAPLLQSKGITHSLYSLPAIEDKNTGAVVMDSFAIAKYLDETYPDTPAVLDPAASAVLEQIGNVFLFGGGTATTANTTTENSRGFLPLVFLVLGYERLNSISKTYYYQTRAARYGERWTTLVRSCFASPEERAEGIRQGIEAMKGLFHKVKMLYDRLGELPDDAKSGGPFVLGKEPCFFDFMVASRIKFMLDGLTPSEVEALTVSDGKRLMQLVEDLEIYYVTQ